MRLSALGVASLKRIMTLPELADRLAKLGMQPATSTPAELAAYLKAEIVKWTKVVRDAGIKAD